jgi:simple sugar transport system ATP-binding protein
MQPPTIPPAIAMRGITKRFASVVANDDVSFEVRPGEVHALVGENGAGKSTLMSILTGLYQPDGGTIEIGGEAVSFAAPKDAIAAGIGMVHQHFMLVEPFTVAENVLLGLPKRGKGVERLDTAAIERELTELSRRFGLDVDPHAHVWQLSVGEQQRVEIVRLLHRGAKILILDEPTAVLTPQEARGLIAVLKGMAEQGFAIVFISHKLDEVLAVSDRITVLRRGKTVATRSTSATTRHELAELMVGREGAATLERVDAERLLETREASMLSVRDIHAVSDRGLAALEGVSFDVAGGEILGIAGVAGNGQSELAEVLTGLRRATRGTITVGDDEITNASAGDVARAGVAHIPEDRLSTGLVASMSLADNAILRQYRDDPISKGPFLIDRKINEFTESLLSDYDVQPGRRRVKAGFLSGGNQQKLLLGRELSGRPRVIVAMHPTRGVDIGATRTIHHLLALQRERGAAILVISEDLDELLAIADRIAVIYDGRLTGVVDARNADINQLGLLMTGASNESAAHA